MVVRWSPYQHRAMVSPGAPPWYEGLPGRIHLPACRPSPCLRLAQRVRSRADSTRPSPLEREGVGDDPQKGQPPCGCQFLGQCVRWPQYLMNYGANSLRGTGHRLWLTIGSRAPLTQRSREAPAFRPGEESGFCSSCHPPPRCKMRQYRWEMPWATRRLPVIISKEPDARMDTRPVHTPTYLPQGTCATTRSPVRKPKEIFWRDRCQIGDPFWFLPPICRLPRPVAVQIAT